MVLKYAYHQKIITSYILYIAGIVLLVKKYLDSIAIAPFLSSSYTHIAKNYISMNKFDKAIEILEEALSAKKGSSYSLFINNN